MISAKQRVANGVEFLNETCPNWKEKIDVSKLDLSSANNCIMGQIGWPDKQDMTPFSTAQYRIIAELCGFLATYDCYGEPTLSYDELQKEWLEVLS